MLNGGGMHEMFHLKDLCYYSEISKMLQIFNSDKLRADRRMKIDEFYFQPSMYISITTLSYAV